MSRLAPILRALAGIALGVLVSVPAVGLVGRAFGTGHSARYRLVPEDASGHLRRIAIHYSPALDARALPVWRRLFAVLPADVEVDVAVSELPDFERLMAKLGQAGVHDLERFHAVPVHQPLTSWSRDRMAALAGPDGEAAILAPPRVETVSADRAGDWQAPFALSRQLYGQEPRVANFVFEGGDLAASRHHLFADVNLVGHNLGRGDSGPAHLRRELQAAFTQDVIWLGDEPGDVPVHHIMMYLVPLDDDTVAVGDVRLGSALLAAQRLAAPGLETPPVAEDAETWARRFDRAAELARAHGLRVVRLPVVVLEGGGSYVTYTNALFDRDAAGPIVYLPTYRLPMLDDAARRAYEDLGFRVVDIDVSTIYKLNGSLGCLVNVLGRSDAGRGSAILPR